MISGVNCIFLYFCKDFLGNFPFNQGNLNLDILGYGENPWIHGYEIKDIQDTGIGYPRV